MTADGRCLAYVVYGEDPVYYQGAIFSLLTLMRASGGSLSYPVRVMSEQPAWFEEYPVHVTRIEPEQIADWSLEGRYPFRIKSRAVATILAEGAERLIFLDTDTVFRRSIDDLFDRIDPGSALLYLDEGPILEDRRHSAYSSLAGRTLSLDGANTWTATEQSRMWGSLLIGVHRDMARALEEADTLLLALLDVVDAHTVEQFALAESLRLNGIAISETHARVQHYSTFGKKRYAGHVLARFFEQVGRRPIAEQMAAARPALVRRPLSALIRQKLRKQRA